MKPVLLTGATGFIGQRLQKYLLDNEQQVTAVVRPESTHKNSLLPGVNRLQADLSDCDVLAGEISRSAAVIYSAGSVRGRRLEDFRAANISGVRSMVNAMNKAGATVPLLLISSLAASRPHVSDYANSKYLGEQEVRGNASFPWTIFRPPAVYGPGDKEMLPILKLARKGLITPTGPREQRLSLIHVDDLAMAVLAWLKSWDRCQGEVFTLDDGHSGGYSWQEIAETTSPGGYRRINIPVWLLSGLAGINLTLSRLFGYSPMLTPGKARELTQADWVCNNKQLSAATGWAPAIGLEQGLLSLFEPSGIGQQKNNGDEN
jgi:nucleoside-diphosphate-sugar epimerase